MWWKGGLGHDRARCGGWVVCVGKTLYNVNKILNAMCGVLQIKVSIVTLNHISHVSYSMHFLYTDTFVPLDQKLMHRVHNFKIGKLNL